MLGAAATISNPPLLHLHCSGCLPPLLLLQTHFPLPTAVLNETSSSNSTAARQRDLASVLSYYKNVKLVLSGHLHKVCSYLTCSHVFPAVCMPARANCPAAACVVPNTRSWGLCAERCLTHPLLGLLAVPSRRRA